MIEPPPTANYGTTRDRAPSVSYAEIEAIARRLMAGGDYPSVAAVRKELKRGSTTTIAEAMRRFWKDQAALNAGNPVALTRLPPEFADAAVDLWEQALRLAQQTAKADDNAARAALDQLRRDTDFRVRSMQLREKEWDMAARVRERALSDARQQLGVLIGELTAARAELRSRDIQSADLHTQIEALRQQLATVIAKAIARHRVPQRTRAAPPGPKVTRRIRQGVRSGASGRGNQPSKRKAIRRRRSPVP
jgi:hypothetical protein